MRHTLIVLLALGPTRWAAASARADRSTLELAERVLALPHASEPDAAARIDVERQRLLPRVYVQAVLEARGPHAREQIRALLERGAWPGLSDQRLPSLGILRNAPGLFAFLYVLTQREPAVANLAFDVLASRAPGEVTYGDALAHYVGQCSRAPEHLAAGLDVFERLYALGPAHRPAPLAEELSDERLNPFLGGEASKAVVVRNLTLEVYRRRGRVQDELLGALAAIDSPVTDEIARAALRDHPGANGVTAVLEGVSRRIVNPDTLRVIAANLPRFADFAADDDGRALTTAARTLLRPFVKNEPLAGAVADLLPQLFTSDFVSVRKLATRAIHWPGLSDDDARRYLEVLLHDPSEVVRRAAVEVSLPDRCERPLRPNLP